MSYCLGVFPKREAKYLIKIFQENPSCTVNFRFRGRGSRKHLKGIRSAYRNQSDLPVKYADKVAIYAQEKKQ